MITQAILKRHQFTTIIDYFRYIARHLGDGQDEDARKQFLLLGKAQRFHFVKWIVKQDYFESLKLKACLLLINSYNHE